MVRAAVLGGGFGGLAAARELRSRLAPTDEVVLVDAADSFAMGFAKLWDLAGVRPLAEGTRPLANLHRHGIRFVQAEVTAIDVAAGTVETSDGPIEFDGLVVALGAVTAPAHAELLRADAAHNLYDVAALPAIQVALSTMTDGRVVIPILGGPFKCPPAPYEAALVVDERLRSQGVRGKVEVVVTTPQPITLPVAGVEASRYVTEHLASRDIEVRTSHVVSGIDGDRRAIGFTDQPDLDYALVLGVPATAPPPVLASSGLTGASGWIEPDRHTLRTGVELVYAVGDCTQIATAKGFLPKAGVFAAAQGGTAAANLAADLGRGEGERFGGHGFCFFELPGRKVAFVEGNFYAEPEPDVHLTEADDLQFRRKQAYEADRLELWLG